MSYQNISVHVNFKYHRNRPMTNVYWVHMPRNLARPPAEDMISSRSISNPEAYLTSESLSTSASCSSKYLLYFILHTNFFVKYFHLCIIVFF